MDVPVLRERINDEGEFALLLEEKYRIKDWYRMIDITILGPEPKHHKVYLAKNCQVFDLLVAFEEYLDMENVTMYYKDCYKKEHQISRDKWFQDIETGSSFLLTDELNGPKH